MIRFLQSGNKAAKYILGGLLTLLALSMCVYLIPGFLGNADTTGRTGVVATVDGVDVTSEELAKMTSVQLQRNNYPPQLAPYLMQQVLKGLIQSQEVRSEATRMGLKVSDQEFREEMEHGPMKSLFFPEGKWIGQQAYETQITNQFGMSIPEFERAYRDELLQRKLYNIVTSGASVSPGEVEQAYRDKNIKVKFQYAVLTLEDVQKEIKPAEADLKAFYQANLARYQNSIPEKRKVSYFVLPDKDVENQVTIAPIEIQRYYNAHLDQYRLPDRVRVRHILISIPTEADGKQDPKAVADARAKAEDLLKQVRAGGDFAELAKKNSQDPGSAQNGGELGWIVKGQTLKEFETTAFGQNPGQISDLVQTSYGFHIIQTEEKQLARLKPVSEVKDEIEKTLKSEKVSTLLDQKANAAEALAQKQGLDQAAGANNVKVIDSGPVARGDVLPGIGPSNETMAAIFEATEKSPPQLERFNQGYVIFEVVGINPARTPSFEEIKDRVSSDFKGERGNNLLQKKIRELADRAHSEHDLAKAAKEAGATVKTSDLVGRTSQVPEIGSMNGAANAAFSLKPGEISGPLNLGQKAAVLELTDRQEPSLNDPDFTKARDSLTEQLTSQKAEQAWELFVSNLSDRLEKEKKIKINKDEMDRLTKRG